MKKNIRFIIFSAALVIALGAALIVVMNIPETDDSGEKDTIISDILLYDKTSLDAEEITVKNDEGEFVLVGFSYADQMSQIESESSGKEDQDSSDDSDTTSSNVRVNKDLEEVRINMHYTMQDYEQMELSKDMTDQIAYQCSYVTATMLIDKSGKKYSEYGLDKPVSTVTTTFSDNSEETLYLGSVAPNDSGIYVRWSGSKNVYLMQLEAVNMFLMKKFEMFDKTISEEFDSKAEDNGIVSLSISGTNYKDPIEINSDTESAIASQYKMNSPFREVCAISSVEEVGEALYGIEGDEVVAAQINDEDKKKFGLDKPYIKISAAAADETSVAILASKADDDGYCYIMKDGGDIICKMSTENIKSWYGVKYTDFLAMTYIMPNVTKLNTLAINYDGNETTFELEHKVEINDLFEETTVTTVKHNGEKVDYTNLSTFLDNMSSLSRREMSLKNLDGYEELASFKFTFEGNVTDELIIYKNQKSSYAVTLNGEIEGTTYGEYVESLLEQIDKIALDGELQRLGVDDEESEEADSTSVDSEGETDE